VDPIPFFYIYITIYCKHHLLSARIIYLLQTNIFFHTIRLILCFQQTSEIDNLTASWDKSILVVLCAGSTLLLAPVVRPAKSQLAIIFRSGFFLLLVD
jgi:hypothetical protein